jgi:hypothetical protein
MSHLYLAEKGTCAFIAPKLNHAMFGVVDPNKRDALSFFGLEDTVINHALLIQDIHMNNYDMSTLD